MPRRRKLARVLDWIRRILPLALPVAAVVAVDRLADGSPALLGLAVGGLFALLALVTRLGPQEPRSTP
jgi:hypothetical protein